jgi:hypothetical protein
MAGIEDLVTRIREARTKQQENHNVIVQIGGALKGAFIGIEWANRQLSPRTARNVLKLTKPVNPKGLQRLKLGVSSPVLETALRNSGWERTTFIQPNDNKPKKPPTISNIWKSPNGDESVRLTPKKNGSVGVRAYDGPRGGAGGQWFQQLKHERATDIKGNIGPRGTNNAYPNNEPRTHFQVRPGSRFSGVTSALNSAPIRGAGRALGPVGLIFDGFSLHQAYEADGGRVGEELRQPLGE